jgi:hypothetical protein
MDSHAEDLVWSLVFLHLDLEEVVRLRALSRDFERRVAKWRFWMRYCSNFGSKEGTPFERFVKERSAPAAKAKEERLDGWARRKVQLKEEISSHEKAQLAFPGQDGFLQPPRHVQGVRCDYCGQEAEFLVYYDVALCENRNQHAQETKGQEFKCGGCGWFTTILKMSQFVTGTYGPCGGAWNFAQRSIRRMQEGDLNWIRDAEEQDIWEAAVKKLPPDHLLRSAEPCLVKEDFEATEKDELSCSRKEILRYLKYSEQFYRRDHEYCARAADPEVWGYVPRKKLDLYFK